MSKLKTIFSCQSCGHQSPKWLGRCPDCSQWNSFVEEKGFNEPASLEKVERRSFHDERHPAIPITSIESKQDVKVSTNLLEFDRVLGGGFVKGSLVLIGGDPGIGKSTLALQALHALSKQNLSVLYVSGEESLYQTKIRAERIGALHSSLLLLSETLLEHVIEEIRKLKPKAVVIDSVQTLFSGDLESAPGSISQVREVVSRLMYMAKREGTITVVIGHVTKEGSIAGPRVLEHMVDTVLYFEGDAGKNYRILRAVKNRFGSTNEIGVFEMTELGLQGVKNPSELFLSERPLRTPGSVVVASVEGTRPMLVEIQALVTPTTLAIPRRTTIGVDHNRVAVLAAVLEKRADLSLYHHDVYVNVVGGLRIQDPGVDLGIVAAAASSFLNKSVDSTTLFLGEIGLTGEVRGIQHADIRVQEGERLGFKKCILPASNLRKMKRQSRGSFGLELSGISTIEECIKALF